MVLKYQRLLPTPEDTMHDLVEEDTTAILAKELGDVSPRKAYLSWCDGNHGRGRCESHGHSGQGERSGHGGSNVTGVSHESKCTYCNIVSHTTNICRKQKRTNEGGNNGGMRSIFASSLGSQSMSKLIASSTTYKTVERSEESHSYSTPRVDQKL